MSVSVPPFLREAWPGQPLPPPPAALRSRGCLGNGTLKWRRPPAPVGRGLRRIPSLSRFHRLRYLWINNNKIQDLTFLIKNYCLTELYLHNNELTDISGALKHLCALQILLLHNNQLKTLGKTVKELKGIISLQTLNLFNNPLAQDPDYRLYVIYSLPSVQLLDRKSVTQRERESALHLYNHQRSCVVQSVAFGKRVNTHLGTAVGSNRCTQPARRLMMPSGIYNNDVNLEITQIKYHLRTPKMPFYCGQ
ncbi:leucine-rich repeat-containing protein 72 isoform X3 [Athene noctua]|uniref:leucine-rich repeat-containing protein 72 isoform X3 n=1 Tax=Athene noctua TaxID=126797 RepID=UPI003EB88D6D